MKTQAFSAKQDLGLGGLYDFLPPPDPEKDKAHVKTVKHVLFHALSDRKTDGS